MDALELLEHDHHEVEELFDAFENAGKKARREKRELVDRMIEELARHSAVEEALLYPAARKALSAAHQDEDIVLESLEEHHVVKWTLHELEDMKPDHERFDAKVSVLMETVRLHVHEEEEHLFPMLREAMSSEQLDRLGTQLEKAKRVAPTRPHPRSPDEPPGNLLATPLAAMVDRSVQAAKTAPARGARAVRQSLAARRASEGGEPKRAASAAAKKPGPNTNKKKSSRSKRSSTTSRTTGRTPRARSGAERRRR